MAEHQSARRTRILVGYDSSPRSVMAMAAAALLLPDVFAWTAHVWAPPGDAASLRRLAVEAGSAEALAERMDADGALRAGRVAGSGAVLASALGWDAEPVVRRGLTDAGAELVRLAGELEPDLVLLGSRGARGALALLDSVSDLVTHRSDRPVLVVPGGAPDFGVLAGGPVVLGWDGSEGAVSGLAAARRLFPARQVVAVAAGRPVAAPPADAAGEKVEFVEVPAGPSPTHSRAVAHLLADQAADRKAALVVVGSRGRPTISEVLLGSVAMATLHHGGQPVLVVPPAGPAGA